MAISTSSTPDSDSPSDSPSEPSSDGGRRLAFRDLTNPWVFISAGFGSGMVRPAPGTWGSLLGVVIWWYALANLAWPLQLAACVIVFAIGTWTTAKVIEQYGVHDPGAVVVDEIVGVWLALLMVPQSLLMAALAFGLFRFFDIVKPWPVSWADQEAPGAFGVMLDDVLAGLLACVVLQVSLLTIPSLAPLLS